MDENVCKTGVAFHIFFDSFGRVAVAPAGDGVFHLSRPFDAAVFADEIRLAVVFLTGSVVFKNFGIRDLGVTLAVDFDVLVVVVNIVDIRNDVIVTARIDARTNGVDGLGIVIDRADESVILLSAVYVPRFVEWTPANECGMVVIGPLSRGESINQTNAGGARSPATCQRHVECSFSK